MCLHPQYLFRHDIYKLYQQGYNRLYFKDKFLENITYKNFRRTRQGMRFTLGYSNVLEYHSQDETHICQHKEDRKQNLKYYAVYRQEPTYFELLNTSTSEVVKLYTEVSCGNCEICNYRKVQRLSHRATLQSIESNVPFFLTLTYTPHRYLKFKGKDNEECKEILKVDAQRFFKRLRKRLDFYCKEKGLEPTKLKYILVSERGKKTNRYHFHSLIWLNSSIFRNLEECKSFSKGSFYYYKTPHLTKFIRRAWKQGNVYNEIALDQSGKYCAKYISKQNENIRLMSKKLGYSTIDKVRDILFEHPRITEFTFLNPYNNTRNKIPVCSFITRYVYPSISRSLPVRFRRLIDIFKETAYQYNFIPKIRLYFEHLHRIIEPLKLTDIEEYRNEPIRILRTMSEIKYQEKRILKIWKQIVPYLKKYMNQFSYIHLCDEKHQEHLQTIEKSFNIDYSHKLTKIHKQRIDLYNREGADNQ